MRGKAYHKQLHFERAGITPAYAGKSCPFQYQRRCKWDHPRLCGEKAAASAGWTAMSGSPPPMRGKADFVRNIHREGEDHPRLCGEKVPFTLLLMLVTGSPPPMRGKATFPAEFLLLFGITPAYAGKRQTANF